MIGIYACTSGFMSTNANHPTTTESTMHPFYEQQEAERAVRIRQERAQAAGYLDGTFGEPRREVLPDVRDSYSRGFAAGELARTMQALVVRIVGEAGEHRHVVAVRGTEPPECLTHDDCDAAVAVSAHKLADSLRDCAVPAPE